MTFEIPVEIHLTLIIISFCRIKVLPPMVFENLNSLEILNLQNNKLTRITEDITENIVDTLEVLDLTGKSVRNA